MKRKELSEDWTAIIEAARRYPGGIRDYLKLKGISHATYYKAVDYFRKKRPDWFRTLPPPVKGRGRKKRTRRPAFVPVTVVSDQVQVANRERVEIRLGSGHVAVLPSNYSPEQIGQLLRAMGG